MLRFLKIESRFQIPAFLTVIFLLFPTYATAWSTAGHKLSGAIAYHILRRESPPTIVSVKIALQSHPWYENHWRGQLEKLSFADRDEMLFMLAARWSDDIRTEDRSQDRGSWHYINWPSGPEEQPYSVRTPPENENILTALAYNESIPKSGSTSRDQAIALTWLFHLIGDVHQPLHTSEVFSVDHFDNEICVRTAPDRRVINLHEFWDSVIISRLDVTLIRNEATALRNRPEFARRHLAELTDTGFKSWAKESFDIATKIPYPNTIAPGSRKEKITDCGKVDAAVTPAGYATTVRGIAARRIMLAAYRLSDALKRLVGA